MIFRCRSALASAASARCASCSARCASCSARCAARAASYIASFTCIDDTTSPWLSVKNPAENSSNIALNSNVYFELDDDLSGVNLNTLNVYFDTTTQVVLSGLFQAGYTGTTIDDGAGGYDVTINPDTNFSFGQSVEVSVQVYDIANNAMPAVNYNFIAALTPQVSGQAPAPAENNVPLDSDIFFRIDDYDDDYDSTSLYVTIEGDAAILGGALQVGFSGAITYDTTGANVTINPGSNFTYGQVVDLTIDASDLQSNVMPTFSYNFTCIDDVTPPFITAENPVNGATDVPLNTDIYFEIDDNMSGVNLSTLTVYFDTTTQVFLTGTFQPGFTGAIVDDAAGGYDVTINPDSDFSSNQVVIVTIDAQDKALIPNVIDRKSVV